MSLEQAIADNTAAIKEQTAFLKALQGKAGAGAAATTTSTKPAGKPAGKKAVTLDTIKERYGAYLGVENKKEREVRKGKVQAILAHFGEVAKVSEIAEESWVDAIAALDKLEAGELPDFMEGDGDGGDDEALV